MSAPIFPEFSTHRNRRTPCLRPSQFALRRNIAHKTVDITEAHRSVGFQSLKEACTSTLKNTIACPFCFPNHLPDHIHRIQQPSRIPQPLTDSRHDPDEQHLHDVLRVVQSAKIHPISLPIKKSPKHTQFPKKSFSHHQIST